MTNQNAHVNSNNILEFLETQNQKANLGDWPVYQIFGLNLASDYAFGKRLLSGKGLADISFNCADSLPIFMNWESIPPIFASQQKNVKGESVISSWLLEDFYMIRYAEFADYYLWEGGIVCLPTDLQQRELAAIHILPGVVALWLELYRGIPSLHGSGVKINSHAIIFLGHKNAGKSTLAISFAKAGFPLLSDDTIPIEKRDEIFWGRSAYPQARLWPEQVAHYIDEEMESEMIQSDYAKQRILLNNLGAQWFWDQALPLSSIYIASRRDSDDKDNKVEIIDLPSPESLVELMRYSIFPLTSQAFGLTHQRFDLFSKLAQKIPVRRIIYPNGHQFLTEVQEAIQIDQMKMNS